jgi:group II intron reverse transcriptase/maturase
VVQAGLKVLLEPLFEPEFSPSSYGFRPGRSPQQAVEAAKTLINSGKPYVVDIDLANFFDRINHDRLIARMGQKIKDKRILRLIGMTLRSGVMINGVICRNEEGTMQGSPLSPLLSNIVLDELDKELERRELAFCRFADDCNIFVKTQKAAERVMESVSHFIENKLKLKVNREKSQVARSEQVKFLGFTVVNGSIAVARKATKKAMQKVKALTPRGTHLDMKTTLEAVNSWYKGWSGYFKLTQYPSQLATIEAHIRRRLRARIIDQQKRKRFLVHNLVKRGISKSLAARTVYTNRNRWALSKTYAVERAYPNDWFRRKGQYIRSDQQEDHWFGVHLYVYLA